MNKFQVKTIVILLLLISSIKGYAAQDSLILYTKPDCSNCHSVKLVLHQSGISFIEKSLAITANATEMLRKLAELGYRGEIYLPVIFVNNQLYHPVFQKGKSLVKIPLPNIIDTIKYKFNHRELNLPAYNNEITSKETDVPATGNSDCEMKTAPVYVVCANYNTEVEAKAEMNKLIAKGYTYAGYIFYQKQYRVFSKFFYDRSLSDTELNEIKKSYNEAYLFEVPK